MTVDIVESFQINDDCSIGDFIYIETTLPERNPTINCIYIYQKMSDIHKLSSCRYPIMDIKDGRHVVYVDM